tara:strand:- start:656 stop:1297 length:642 start_codon:yes stop_codon:yes gene_type:complete
MKITDILKENEGQVKQDAQKVSDLIKSNQSVNVAVDTYVAIHGGKLDYDAAYSKASQKAFGRRVTKSGEAPDPSDVDRLKQREIDTAVAKRIAQQNQNVKKGKKEIGGEVKSASQKRKEKGQEITQVFDPITGKPRRIGPGAPIGNMNAYKGADVTGALSAFGKRFVRDPLKTTLNPLGTDTVGDTVDSAAKLGQALFTPRIGRSSKSNLSIR